MIPITNLLHMKLLIKDSRTLAELQKEFNAEFPYLKIEFFETPHEKNRGALKSKMYSNSRTVASCRKKHDEGEISIARNETVAQLEQEFWDRFNLSVQVFRKSASLWIETTLTDAWTLDRQNTEGHELSDHKTPKEISDDLDITDRDKWD